MPSQELLAELRRDEGLRLHAYPDPKTGGAPWTVGFGHTGPEVKPGTVWTEEQAEAALVADANKAARAIEAALPWTAGLDQVRRETLIAMAFNMGTSGLLKFRNMLAALRDRDYERASWNMLWNAPGRPTQWAIDVKGRARRLAAQMQSGERT